MLCMQRASCNLERTKKLEAGLFIAILISFLVKIIRMVIGAPKLLGNAGRSSDQAWTTPCDISLVTVSKHLPVARHKRFISEPQIKQAFPNIFISQTPSPRKFLSDRLS